MAALARVARPLLGSGPRATFRRAVYVFVGSRGGELEGGIELLAFGRPHCRLVQERPELADGTNGIVVVRCARDHVEDPAAGVDVFVQECRNVFG